MHFAFTDEQEQLRKALRALIERSSAPDVRSPDAADPGHDRTLWTRLATEIGAHALAIPERHGGAGFSLLESMIVVEELGRRLVASPFLASAVLGSAALVESGDQAACDRLLPHVASGDSIATLGWAEPDTGWSAERLDTTARRVDGAWRLTGSKQHVLDGAAADVVLVLARTDRGPTLFEVDPAAAARCRTTSVPMDPTRRTARFDFRDTPATLVGTDGAATPVMRRCTDVAAAALAAEQVGAAHRWLYETVEYTKVRRQFGRPIGSFQALKHRMADLLVEVESARSASYAASWAVSTRDSRASEFAAMAKSYCSQAYHDVAAEGIQLHGGIGITWEHEAHLHLKRAHSAAQLFGSPREHRHHLEQLLGLTRAGVG